MHGGLLQLLLKSDAHSDRRVGVEVSIKVGSRKPAVRVRARAAESGRRWRRGELVQQRRVVAVVAVVVGTLAATAGAAPSDDIADAQKNAALVKAGPMTPEKARPIFIIRGMGS